MRFWDRWLKGLEPAATEPMVMAYLQDGVKPQASLEHRPGRWVGEQAWPSPRIAERVLALGDGTLGGDPVAGTRSVGSVQTVGLDGGAWCADGRSADLPLDQRAEDSRSLTFTSAPLDAPLEILGFAPRFSVKPYLVQPSIDSVDQVSRRCILPRRASCQALRIW